MTEQRCAGCGARFECGAGTGSCWCADVELNSAARAALEARFEGCLCRDCLGAASALSRSPDPSRERSAADAPRR